MSGNFKTPVVVLAGSPHGNLGIVRSLGRLGVDVYLLRTETNTVASLSRYCTQTLVWPGAAKDRNVCLDVLARVAVQIGKRAILLPTCDDDAIFAAEHFETLRHSFIYPQQSAELAHSLVSKKEMYFLAKKHNVPTPDALFPASLDETRQFARAAKFPIMVKGVDGNRLKRKLGAGVLIAKSAADLMSICERAGEGEQSNLMLQEYIPGSDNCVWMFNGYFDGNSNCLFGVTGRKIRQYPAYTGATSLGVCLENKNIQHTTRRWMKELGYRGILDIGYRYDARDGQYKVLDVNPRIGATFRLFVAQDGMDVARAMYLDLTGHPVVSAPVREGRKWVVEDCDLGSSLRYWRDDTLTLPQWARSLWGIQEAAYFAADDPLPFVNMCARSLKSKLNVGVSERNRKNYLHTTGVAHSMPKSLARESLRRLIGGESV
ncbi:MAG: carboxylate--amine ligase [Acidobacteria bacterium]|nr:carboxylate--amine ligase [Acidobacteriota bacterium]